MPCDIPMPVGTVMKYRCKDFYRPVGNKGRDNGQMTCQADGTWNREHLQCEPGTKNNTSSYYYFPRSYCCHCYFPC